VLFLDLSADRVRKWLLDFIPAEKQIKYSYGKFHPDVLSGSGRLHPVGEVLKLQRPFYQFNKNLRYIK
jgi:hypothetical protein